MKNRRQLLKRSAVLSLTPTLPSFLARSAFASQGQRDGRILVIIQLTGGNDGINTVVPFKDEGYAKHRRELGLPEHRLIKLGGDLAFHPRLRAAGELFSEDRLSVVHAVGYPNPNRSHFESMDIWHTARLSADERKIGRGWLGEAVSSNDLVGLSQAVHVGDDPLPVALRGRRCSATSLASLEDLKLNTPEAIGDPIPERRQTGLQDFVRQSVRSAYATAEEIMQNTRADASVRYPTSKLAERLRLVSQMIKSGSESRIYYTSQRGYDTHASQSLVHANLLGTLSSSLKAFMDDMRESGLEDRVLVMAFSEFGRRVAENASGGTDHGTAGPVLLAGKNLADRQYGQMPSLMNLESGDLRYACDFRDLYAGILQGWLDWELPLCLHGFEMDRLFD
ncbi:MAG: DUF1501 domain-containing protein [Planctomycetota bacterium]